MKHSLIILVALMLSLIGCSSRSEVSQTKMDGEDSLMVDDKTKGQKPLLIGRGEGCVSVNLDSCQGVKFIVYHPNYSCVRLVCGDIPTGNDKKQIFCAAAAFTGVGYENGFDHKLIAGNHTSDGVYYKGYKCERNSGAFVFYDGKHKFLYKEYAAEMEKSANHHGMGFAQEMMIHEGSRVATYRKDDNMNVFRALCEKDGQVCVVESESVVKFGDFINALIAYGISEALYLDMGGWAYSWYRSADGKTVYTHEYGSDVLTNAIVFEK